MGEVMNDKVPLLPLDCARCDGVLRGSECSVRQTCKRFLAGQQKLPYALERTAVWMWPRAVGDACEYRWPID